MHLVITDLDGTLLDHDTYSFEDAKPALDVLTRRRIPLVICTSKTRAEVEVWRNRLNNGDPFIVENGGAVFIPSGLFPFAIPSAVAVEGYEALQLGTPYPILVEALGDAAQESGCRIFGFSGMSVQQVAEACNMDLGAAALAKRREYDEPFLIQDAGRAGFLLAAIESRGFRWTRGGRFHHITGENDKAKAVELLAGFYRQLDSRLITIGLGDGPNDVSFLLKVDVPILMRTPQAQQLRTKVPHARITHHPGPRGWNQAVLDAIAS
jgi:mannosyl-3-phosphoglycerate phosphatase